MPHLLKQIDLIKPKIILVLGRIAAQQLLSKNETLAGLRGVVHHFNEIPVFVTYHPAALLRNQQWKRQTWEDVQLLRKHYDDLVGDKPPLKVAGKQN